jgi:hypothetical protein
MGPWREAEPTDGKFDSSSERFRFKLPPGFLSLSGASNLEVRARNEGGFWTRPITKYSFSYSGPSRAYDFEGGLVFGDFRVSGQPWYVDFSKECSEGACMRSGKVVDDQFSTLWLPIDLPLNVSSVSFDVKVSSESGSDRLTFKIGNTIMDEWSGDVAWKRVKFALPPLRPLNLEWNYRKDSDKTQGIDAAWIDNIEFR